MAQLSYLSEKGNQRKKKRKTEIRYATYNTYREFKNKEEEHHFDQVRRTRGKKKRGGETKTTAKKKKRSTPLNVKQCVCVCV